MKKAIFSNNKKGVITMGFIDDSYVSAKAIFDSAIKKAGETVEIQKIRIEIAKLRSAISTAYGNLGEQYYSELKGDEKNQSEIENIVNDIDEKNCLLEELYKKFNEAKHNKVCGSCGRVNSEDSAFCNGCGEKL